LRAFFAVGRGTARFAAFADAASHSGHEDAVFHVGGKR
jgi:hypothetical protein